MTQRFRMRRAGGVLAAASLLAAGLPVMGLAAAPAQAVSDDLVISQVYGGGGNAGATYTHDFIELFNRGATPVDLEGMSVQYASATGSGNFGANDGQLATLSGTLEPGQRHLVGLAGGSVGSPLPSADTTGTINMSGSAGKVALVEGTTGLGCNGGSTTCDATQLARIVDLVGFGNANFYEGPAAAPTLSNSTAAVRAAGGCTDTDDNSADFAAGAPTPRNSSHPAEPCAGGPIDAVVISQVYGGGGNAGATYTHDFVELFNRGTNTVDLSGMSVQYASASGTGNFAPAPLTGSLEPGQRHLVQLASGANGDPLPVTPDDSSPTPNLSGTAGKVALADTTVSLGCNGGSNPCTPDQLDLIVDLVGYGNANFFEGNGPAPTLSASTAGIRAGAGCTDTDNNNADFTAGAPTPRNSTSPLTPCAGGPIDNPPVTSCPATLVAPFEQGASAPVSAVDDNDGISSIAITSDPVAGITLDAVDLGAGSAVLTVAASTDPGNYAVTVEFVTDGETQQSSECTVEVSVAHGLLLVSTVQGDGAASPLDDEVVTVEGIVTSLFEDDDVLSGFFLQEEDADADSNPATSEGIFVFCGSACPAEGTLAEGHQVAVTGTVDEFFDMTQVSATGTGADITVSATGMPLPAAVPVDLPASGSTEAAATFESTEGMVMTFPDTLVVSEYFELARFGQLILTVDERPYQFTHDNAPSIDGYQAHLADLATRRIILGSNNDNQNDATSGPENNEPYPWPEGGLSIDNRVRGGDTIEDLTGVLHWSFDAWRVRPIESVDYEFEAANPAPAEPEDVGGRLTVTSYNVLNYFATIDTSNNCGPLANMDCRGADSDIERQRQLAKIAAGLAEIDADVAGLIEIENDGDNEAVQQIVEALNAKTAPGTYDYIETGFIGGDAIKVALVYQPATVSPVGGYEILDSQVNPLFRDDRNRPVLIQTFEENSTGEVFTIAVNHLKSKGSACTGDPDLGDGQGNCNETRVAAVQALMDFLATDPTESGDPDFLIVGDLNSYAMEDPITTLEAAGWTDLHEEFEGPEGYSYVFDGQLGYLDTALANPELLPQVTGTTAWHINADEVPLFDYNDEFQTADEADFERESNALELYRDDPLRSSDHDPVIVGLSLGDPAEVVADLRETLAGMDIHHGIKNALDAKLRAAEQSISRGNANAACGQLGAFINQVNAQTGKKVSPAQALVLLEEARIARVMLDC